MCAKIGPGLKTNSRCPLASVRTWVPMISAGIKSGVNWMRLKLSPSTSLAVLTISVLPNPGTPSIRIWPPAKSAVRSFRTTSRWPTITFPTSSSARAKTCWNSATRWSGDCFGAAPIRYPLYSCDSSRDSVNEIAIARRYQLPLIGGRGIRSRCERRIGVRSGGLGPLGVDYSFSFALGRGAGGNFENHIASIIDVEADPLLAGFEKSLIVRGGRKFAQMGIAAGAAAIGLLALPIGHFVARVVSGLRNRHWSAALLIGIFAAAALLIGIVPGPRRLRGFRIGVGLVGRLAGREVIGLNLCLRFRELIFQIDAVGGATIIVLAVFLAAAFVLRASGATAAFAFSAALTLT